MHPQTAQANKIIKKADMQLGRVGKKKGRKVEWRNGYASRSTLFTVIQVKLCSTEIYLNDESMKNNKTTNRSVKRRRTEGWSCLIMAMRKNWNFGSSRKLSFVYVCLRVLPRKPMTFTHAHTHTERERDMPEIEMCELVIATCTHDHSKRCVGFFRC